jgi:hypothetical protein
MLDLDAPFHQHLRTRCDLFLHNRRRRAFELGETILALGQSDRTLMAT